MPRTHDEEDEHGAEKGNKGPAPKPLRGACEVDRRSLHASADFDRTELVGKIRVRQLDEALHVRPQQIVYVRAETRQYRKFVGNEPLGFLINELALDGVNLGPPTLQHLVHLRI